MFCHQGQYWFWKDLLITHHWWAVHPFKSSMSNIKIFQMQFPSLFVFLGFFPTFRADISTRKEGGEVKNPVLCSLLFTVFNQLLQNLSQDIIPCILKEEGQLCAVQESKHSLHTGARSTLQIFASTAVFTAVLGHDLWLRLQRPLQYGYSGKIMMWLQ